MKNARTFARRWDALLAAHALPESPTEAEKAAAWAHFNAQGLAPDGLEYLYERAQLLCRGEEDRLLVGFVHGLMRGDITRRQYEEALEALHRSRQARHRRRWGRVDAWA